MQYPTEKLHWKPFLPTNTKREAKRQNVALKNSLLPANLQSCNLAVLNSPFFIVSSRWQLWSRFLPNHNRVQPFEGQVSLLRLHKSPGCLWGQWKNCHTSFKPVECGCRFSETPEVDMHTFTTYSNRGNETKKSVIRWSGFHPKHLESF